MNDLVFFGGGPLLILAVPVAMVVSYGRARRQQASTARTILSVLGTGFITAVIAAFISFVAVMIMWGLSV